MTCHQPRRARQRRRLTPSMAVRGDGQYRQKIGPVLATFVVITA